MNGLVMITMVKNTKQILTDAMIRPDFKKLLAAVLLALIRCLVNYKNGKGHSRGRSKKLEKRQ